MQCFIPRVDIIVSLRYLSFVLGFCLSLMSVVSPLEFLSTSLTVFLCLFIPSNKLVSNLSTIFCVIKVNPLYLALYPSLPRHIRGITHTRITHIRKIYISVTRIFTKVVYIFYKEAVPFSEHFQNY